jgi:hypothetical protein
MYVDVAFVVSGVILCLLLRFKVDVDNDNGNKKRL